MLKKFFLIVCGSFVGSFLALVFFVFAAVMMSVMIFGSMSSTMGTTGIEKNSILYIRLEGELNERSSATGSLMSMMYQQESNQDLNTLIKSLKLAKTNKAPPFHDICFFIVASAPTGRRWLRQLFRGFR